MNACGFINTDVTIKGMIDTAGYAVNASSCKDGNHTSTGLALLDTTNATQWYQAHKEFCCSNVTGIDRISCSSNTPRASCHYPHEQLLATVAMGNSSALLLSRQRYPYNANTSDACGLLRISRLQLNNLNSSSSTAELDGSSATNDTVLFGPGEHHLQLQPGRVLLALANESDLTLLSRSNGTDYHLGTLPLKDQHENINVTMQPLKGLEGEPVMLMFGEKQQPPQIWTHKNSAGNDTFTLYKQAVNGTDPVELVKVANYSLTSANDAVIAMGANERWLYIVAKRNQGGVILECINRTSEQVGGQPTRLNMMAALADSDGAGLPYTVQVGDDQALGLIPRHAIWAKDGADGQLKVWQIELPNFGGPAQWRVSAETARVPDGKACLRMKEDEPSNTLRAPLEGPLIGSAMATFGLCCTAAVAGLIGKKCWQRHKNRADKATPAPETAANDSEAAMELQEKGDSTA